MRIVAGSWRGRALRAPQGIETRPTSDRVREAVFSAIEARMGDIDGLRVLDAFAGSGAFGFEALSRGARSVVFIESDRRARDTIVRNAEAFHANPSITVIPGDVFALATARLRGGPFALLFVDPPYRIVPAQVSRFLEDLSSAGSLAEGALVVYEHAARGVIQWPAGFEPLQERRYGITEVSYARYEGMQLS